MLLGDLLAQVLEHREQLLVRSAALAHRSHGLGLPLLLVVIVVERHRHGERHGDEILALAVHRDQSVILDILVHQSEDERLTQYGTPEGGVVLGACAEPLALVVTVTLYQRRGLARQHIHQIVALELVADVAQSLQQHLQRGLGVDLWTRIAAVVAVAAVLLRILLAEIVQQRLAAAHRTLGIRDRLLQQQFADLLLGDRFALHELFEFLDILVTVKGQTVTLAAVASRTTRLLIIPFERLGNVVMDDEPHVGLVDTHAESDRGDDHIGALHQEIVLILGARGRIHARMIGQRLDAVGYQQLGQFLDLLAAQTIDDAAAPLLLLDEADDVAVHVVLGTDFVIEIRTVERRFENRGVVHAEVLLDVQLHLRRGRRRQGDQRRRADLVDDRADAAVLRTEIVAPLRNAVRLVDGVERYLDFAQKRDVVLLGKRLGGEIEQLGAPLQHVGAHLRHGGLVERRIEEMGDARLRRESAHGVHLILHQGDQRRNDDRHAVHQQRRQLVTERLAAARGHQHERVFSSKHIADYSLLIAFERRKAEILLELPV